MQLITQSDRKHAVTRKSAGRTKMAKPRCSICSLVAAAQEPGAPTGFSLLAIKELDTLAAGLDAAWCMMSAEVTHAADAEPDKACIMA